MAPEKSTTPEADAPDPISTSYLLDEGRLIRVSTVATPVAPASIRPEQYLSIVLRSEGLGQDDIDKVLMAIEGCNLDLVWFEA